MATHGRLILTIDDVKVAAAAKLPATARGETENSLVARYYDH